jgi:phosphatidylserine/phosphatidylglycerophosphate/cardiolipin synthase-like enzyme
MTNDDFTVLTRAEYFADVAVRAAKATSGDRIVVATMTFRPEEPTVQHLVESLAAAGKRGADVLLMIDAYNFLIDEHQTPGPLFFRSQLPKRLRDEFQQKMQWLSSLADQGVQYVITNMPKGAPSNPFAGRSHIKFAVINERVYIGGCNLSHAEQIDVMTAWDDKKTADWLYDFGQRMIASGGTSFMDSKDIERPVDAQSTILVDAGARKQSIILQNALEIIDDAEKELFITCQYFPGGVTAQHLLVAHQRGVKVTIAYSPPGVHGRQALAHHLHKQRERLRLPKEFFAGQLPKSLPKLHAKVLASEKAAIIGSHNFVSQGVNWGTAEIALLRRNKAFAQKLRDFIQNQI